MLSNLLPFPCLLHLCVYAKRAFNLDTCQLCLMQTCCISSDSKAPASGSACQNTNTTDPAALTACLAVLQVVHCLALAADMSGDSAGAIRWLEVLTSLVPHDPGVLCKLGAIYHRLDAAPYGLLPLQALCDVAPFMLHARGACIERLRWCSPAGFNTLSSVGVVAAGPCSLASWRSLSRVLHT